MLRRRGRSGISAGNRHMLGRFRLGILFFFLLWLRGRLLLCAHDWRRGRTATIAVKSGVPVNLASWKEDRFIGLGLIGASSDQLREGDLTAVPRQRLHAGIAPLVYLKGKVKCAW